MLSVVVSHEKAPSNRIALFGMQIMLPQVKQDGENKDIAINL